MESTTPSHLPEGWGVEDGRETYSPDDFYTKTTDGRGHSGTVIQVRFPPGLGAEIDALIATQRIPQYRTRADVVRDAIVHRMHYVAEMVKSDSLKRVTNLEVVMAKLAAHEAELKDLRAMHDGYERRLEDAWEYRDLRSLSRILEDIENPEHQVREPWASRIDKLYVKYKRKLREAQERDARDTYDD